MIRRWRIAASSGKGRQEMGAGQPYAQAEERLAPVRHVATPRAPRLYAPEATAKRCPVPFLCVELHSRALQQTKPAATALLVRVAAAPGSLRARGSAAGPLGLDQPGDFTTGEVVADCDHMIEGRGGMRGRWRQPRG